MQDYASRGFVTQTIFLTEVSSGANVMLTVNAAHILDHASAATRLDAALPSTADTFDIIEVYTKTNTGRVRITCAVGQVIRTVNGDTASDGTGYIESVQNWQSIRLLCINGVNEWVVVGGTGATWSVQ